MRLRWLALAAGSHLFALALRSQRPGPELPDCLQIPGVFKEACFPSIHAGACYTEDASLLEPWECWPAAGPSALANSTEARERPRKLVEYCLGQGKDWACEFKPYTRPTAKSELPHCSSVASYEGQCQANSSKNWGACYRQRSEAWLCLAADLPTFTLHRFRDGDCFVQQADGPSMSSYDGVCVYDKPQRTESGLALSDTSERLASRTGAVLCDVLVRLKLRRVDDPSHLLIFRCPSNALGSVNERYLEACFSKDAGQGESRQPVETCRRSYHFVSRLTVSRDGNFRVAMATSFRNTSQAVLTGRIEVGQGAGLRDDAVSFGFHEGEVLVREKVYCVAGSANEDLSASCRRKFGYD